jgi:hypothetical protein
MSCLFKPSATIVGLVLTFALLFLFLQPVSAEPVKEPKQKQHSMAPRTERSKTVYRGTDKFPAGPLYYGSDYLGDDPDPFIRLQIQRDLGARYPGAF